MTNFLKFYDEYDKDFGLFYRAVFVFALLSYPIFLGVVSLSSVGTISVIQTMILVLFVSLSIPIAGIIMSLKFLTKKNKNNSIPSTFPLFLLSSAPILSFVLLYFTYSSNIALILFGLIIPLCGLTMFGFSLRGMKNAR